jgi:hypothetical protein
MEFNFRPISKYAMEKGIVFAGNVCATRIPVILDANVKIVPYIYFLLFFS